MFAIIIRDIASTIITINDMAVFFRVHPNNVVIGMHVFFTDVFKGFSAINTHLNPYPGNHDFVFVYRANKYFTKIIAIGAIQTEWLRICFFPGFTGIIATVQFCPDDRCFKQSGIGIKQKIPNYTWRVFIVFHAFFNGSSGIF